MFVRAEGPRGVSYLRAGGEGSVGGEDGGHGGDSGESDGGTVFVRTERPRGARETNR